jgi:hypothetical protein
VKAWIVSELVPRPQVSGDPLGRRIIDDMAQFEHGAIRLRFGLLGISAIDEERRLIRQDYSDSGRARESRQPKEPLGARGNILVLMFVSARRDEPGNARPLELLTQFCDARSGVRSAANVSKRLKPALKHWDFLGG